MTEAEILGKMIDRLQDKGWVQGSLWETVRAPDPLGGGSRDYWLIAGGACLEGSAELCGQQAGVDWLPVADFLVAAITDLFPERLRGAYWDAVVKFNDHPDTTFEDVMMVVKTAKENAE